ncbi:MAG: hypothetical protein EHM32_00095 [Spirochaetales bacterium]|nr:MAG: hypothetical protein EHM32_00095 [Spirochaetales bacterium]
MAKKGTVVIGVTGSIAAYRACEIISALKRRSFDVQAVLTEDGSRFITELTLQALTGNKVMTDMFKSPEEWDPAHVALAEKALCVLIAPATANTIGKLACGICDDLLTCVVCATRAPVLIAPAMNDKMYSHAAVQDNIARLKKMGYKFVGPVKGRLACGCEGLGHIADTAEIVAALLGLVR